MSSSTNGRIKSGELRPMVARSAATLRPREFPAVDGIRRRLNVERRRLLVSTSTLASSFACRSRCRRRRRCCLVIQLADGTDDARNREMRGRVSSDPFSGPTGAASRRSEGEGRIDDHSVISWLDGASRVKRLPPDVTRSLLIAQ